MKAKTAAEQSIGTTSDNRRLKKLAREYAVAAMNVWNDGVGEIENGARTWNPSIEARQKYRDARKRLHDAIDSLTILVFGPQAIENYP